MGRKLFLTLFIVLKLAIYPDLAAAQVLNITATVPVSDIWAQAITQNAHIFSAREGEGFIYFVQLRGPNYEVLDNHTVRLEIFSNNKLIKTSTQKTKRFAMFYFLPSREENYTFIFTDITWDRKIKIKEENLTYPFINIFNAFKTPFLLSSTYTNTVMPIIAKNAFFTGKPIK